MEYKVLRTVHNGKSLVRDSVKVSGNRYRHLQIEQRHGMIYMRMKIRSVSS